MLGSIASVPLPDGDEVDTSTAPLPEPALRVRLLREFGIEVPIVAWPAPPRRLVRIRAQAYNELGDYEKLAEAIGAIFA